MPDDHTKRHDNLTRSFREGTIWNEKEEQLRIHLQTIGEQGIPNDYLWPTEIIRALVINHIQMGRVIGELRDTITKLNDENGMVGRRVLGLTLVCTGCGLVQALGVFWFIFHPH